MKSKKVKSIYEGPTRFTPVGESATKQSFKEEVDINSIVKRFTKGMGLENMQGVPLSEKNFGDFSDVTDLRGLYDRMHNAQESFYKLPSKVRLKFDNDPVDFLEFASNPDNLDAMRELGLAPSMQKDATQKDATPAVEPSEAKAE
jgi:hypothetical protein